MGPTALHYFFLAITLFHCCSLVYIFARPRGLAENLAALLLVGLLIDNATLASSAIGLGTQWYEWANVARYGAHSICIPPLLVAALEICRRANFGWAKASRIWIVIVSLAIAGVIFGLVNEVMGIEFEVVELFGHLRLVSADDLPPFATIFTNFLIIVFGITLWRQRGWSWLMLGAGAVFFVNAATATLAWGLLAGNLSEVLFVGSWLVTLRQFPSRD